MEIIYTCPLGSECEKGSPDGKFIYRCRWFQKIQGKNPQSEEVFDEYKCVFEWMNLLTISNTQEARGIGAAIESFRNEMVKQNNNSSANLLNYLKNFPIEPNSNRLIGGG